MSKNDSDVEEIDTEQKSVPAISRPKRTVTAKVNYREMDEGSDFDDKEDAETVETKTQKKVLTSSEKKNKQN